MVEGEIDLWLARIPAVDEPAVVRRCREILSPRELGSCAAFHHENDRRRAMVARALVRETLSRYAPVRPEAWVFVSGAHGKPEIATPAGLRLRFNLSHSGNLIACAVTLDQEIGVDLEDTAREIETLALAQRVFSPEELAAFHLLASAERGRRFFEHWTLKEAYLKARGVGFALAPQNASFDLREPGRVQATFSADAGEHRNDWWFALLGAEPDHVLALAARCRGKACLVRTFLAAPGCALERQFEPRLYAESRRPAQSIHLANPLQ